VAAVVAVAATVEIAAAGAAAVAGVATAISIATKRIFPQENLTESRPVYRGPTGAPHLSRFATTLQGQPAAAPRHAR
jgi:hypothetical protein